MEIAVFIIVPILLYYMVIGFFRFSHQHGTFLALLYCIPFPLSLTHYMLKGIFGKSIKEHKEDQANEIASAVLNKQNSIVNFKK